MEASGAISVSVADFIKGIFPWGTLAARALTALSLDQGDKRWKHYPVWAPDAFAAAALLADSAGAYQYLQFSPDQNVNGDPFQIYGANRRPLLVLGAAWAFDLLRKSPSVERKAKAKEALRITGRITPEVEIEELLQCSERDIQQLWDRLVTESSSVLLPSDKLPEHIDTVPGWWSAAIQLLIIADEASAGVGFHPIEGFVSSVVQAIITKQMQNEDRSPYIKTCVSPLVDRSRVNVMPKSLTPSLGWTLRALSHHLAIVPPIGRLETIWHMNKRRGPPTADRKSKTGESVTGRPLNLLLIPYPYTIRSECFEPKGVLDDRQHGEFQVKALWLSGSYQTSSPRSELQLCVEELFMEAMHEKLHVNGVVFPELAMDWVLFADLSEYFARHGALGREFEFMMAGLSQVPHAEGRRSINGNFVGVRGKIYRQAAEGPSLEWKWDERWDYDLIRAKHHRWKLDRRQIERYGLAHRLDPQKDAWWEGIGIRQRRIDVFSPRAGSTMTTLICEDLARNDPCLDAIRAVGPNLVVALLMDGPQTANRWPAHYAGVLADDPGCSVLTLTCFGMIARASSQDPQRNRSIGFWREARGRTVELQLPVGYHAILVSLRGSRYAEKTLDGRNDGGASYTWELANVVPLRLRGAPASLFS